MFSAYKKIIALSITIIFALTPVLQVHANIVIEGLWAGANIADQAYSLVETGNDATNDFFPIYVNEDNPANTTPPIADPGLLGQKNVLGVGIKNLKNRGFKYKLGKVSLPLYKEDYYWGKFYNGRAGVNELNNMPVLKPGNKISIIGNGYITLSPTRGYVRPGGGFYYASGVCWSVSVLGAIMDNANKEFEEEYGMSLFLFQNRDRAPHSHWYKTYKKSNNGRGYTILKKSYGGQDYTFKVNPAVRTIPGFKNARFKVVLWSKSNEKRAYRGEVLGGYVLSNKRIYKQADYWIAN